MAAVACVDTATMVQVTREVSATQPSQLPPQATQPSQAPLQASYTPTVPHFTHPDDPPGNGASIPDSDSSLTARNHHAQSGDNFNANLFERPFNANSMDVYFPQVDIQKASMANGSPWIYGSISVKGPDPTSGQLDASYAFELDLNKDGRGDALIVANNPVQGDWTTDGVQVFVDPDHQVGGNAPIHAEIMPQGNGYEQKVFENGLGADPDLAWVRVAPEQPNTVWFAFKSSLISNAPKWMWGAWAQHGGLHPEFFDYNDHFTAFQAGSPLAGDSNYPIKELAEMDNTCRWVIGFIPTGSEPGICPPASLSSDSTPVPPSINSDTTLTPTNYLPPAMMITLTPTLPVHKNYPLVTATNTINPKVLSMTQYVQTMQAQTAAAAKPTLFIPPFITVPVITGMAPRK